MRDCSHRRLFIARVRPQSRPRTAPSGETSEEVMHDGGHMLWALLLAHSGTCEEETELQAVSLCYFILPLSSQRINVPPTPIFRESSVPAPGLCSARCFAAPHRTLFHPLRLPLSSQGLQSNSKPQKVDPFRTGFSPFPQPTSMGKEIYKTRLEGNKKKKNTGRTARNLACAHVYELPSSGLFISGGRR